MTEPDWFDEFLDALTGARVQVKFWTCPVEGHSRPADGELRETVRWDGGIARCLHPDCGRTSADRKGK